MARKFLATQPALCGPVYERESDGIRNCLEFVSSMGNRTLSLFILKPTILFLVPFIFRQSCWRDFTGVASNSERNDALVISKKKKVTRNLTFLPPPSHHQ